MYLEQDDCVCLRIFLIYLSHNSYAGDFDNLVISLYSGKNYTSCAVDLKWAALTHDCQERSSLLPIPLRTRVLVLDRFTSISL